MKDTIVVNDRWGKGIACHHGDYFTCSDRYHPGKLLEYSVLHILDIPYWIRTTKINYSNLGRNHQIKLLFPPFWSFKNCQFNQNLYCRHPTAPQVGECNDDWLWYLGLSTKFKSYPIPSNGESGLATGINSEVNYRFYFSVSTPGCTYVYTLNACFIAWRLQLRWIHIHH